MARWLPIGLLAFTFTVVSAGCKGGDAPKGDGGKNENEGTKKSESPKTDFSVPALDLVKEFIADEKAATTKYKDKLIEVTGEVSSVQDGSNFYFVGAKKKPNDTFAMEVGCFLGPEYQGKAARLCKAQKVKAVGKFAGIDLDTYLMVVESSVTELEKSKVLTTTATDLAAEFEKDAEAAREKYKNEEMIVSGTFLGISGGVGKDVELTGTAKTKLAFAVGAVYNRAAMTSARSRIPSTSSSSGSSPPISIASRMIEIDRLKKGQTVEMRGKNAFLSGNHIGFDGGFLVEAK